MEIAKSARIYVAGHKGMVGSAIVRELKKQGFEGVLTAPKEKVDLLIQQQVQNYFSEVQPEVVIMAAARVGGIQANIDFPAKFLLENLEIQNNLFYAAKNSGVKKIVFIGSSCIYPRESKQPIKEEYLLTGELEPTNEGYALAKIAGLKTAYYFNQEYGINTISLMPCNLYGPNDSFDLKHSHVLSALVKRFSDAKMRGDSDILLWGSGVAKREFMHVDDMAQATVFLMTKYNSPAHINVGVGKDISIKDLATLISEKVGFEGEILWDTEKPNGMLRKCLDITKLSTLGYKAEISLESGIEQMIEIYKSKSEKL